MTVQLELWHLILLLTMFFGVVFAFGKLLLSQFETRLDQRFASIEKEAKKADEVERQLLQLRADLPLQYVRREDYIRGQSVIEAKLDALFSELKVVQIKGANNG